VAIALALGIVLGSPGAWLVAAVVDPADTGEEEEKAAQGKINEAT
jgi:hypothetical protein